jgi:hypothetical protein
MILLDENIRHDQGERLRKWRIHFRFLIEGPAHPGVKDPEIIPLLHRLRQVTFFTHDRDYFDRSLLHPAYALVWLDMFDGEAAEYIRRFLHHPDFRTQAKRSGSVVRLQSGGLRYWIRDKTGLFHASWY